MTLIEVIVVLLLISLTSALVTGSINSWQRPETEIDRLALALEMAAERARVRGTPIRFERLPQGYRFSRLDIFGNWQPVVDDPQLKERSLAAGVVWRHLNQDGQEVVGGLVFGSDVPLYTLEVGVQSGAVLLVGQPSGALKKILLAGPA
jgi:Tfp pilus assembly protein FimT